MTTTAKREPIPDAELDLTDTFAGQAMQGMLATAPELEPEHIADNAYYQALAMMSVRRRVRQANAKGTLPP